MRTRSSTRWAVRDRKRPVRETDKVLATILFTDIVDSTKRQAEIGDRGWKEPRTT
jgi:class 3 adenylate cyclase